MRAAAAGRSGVVLTDCRLPKLAAAAKCTTVEVPARADAPAARIGVTVLPANTLTPRPDPLFMLAGGPGQVSSALLPLANQLSGVRRTRDIVLIDPRGAGRSGALSCAALKARDPFEALADEDASSEAVQRCLVQLRDEQKVDLAQFTTEVLVGDVDAVRAALGYGRINLWGGSYGTRVVQHYVRRHEDQVRSIVLDGVATPGLRVPLDVWTTREDALQRALAACGADAACRAAYPDLDASLKRLREQLATPRTVTLTDPRTGAQRDVVLTSDLVTGALEALLYLPELTALIPPLVSRAAAGDVAPLLAAAVMLSEDVAESLNLPLYYAVACAEDAPRIAADDVRATLAQLAAPWMAARNLAACDGWPPAVVAADFALPLASTTPALILSGGIDPVTPPRNGEQVAKTLPHSRHVIAAGYGHIVSPHACAPRLIEKFIEDASADALSASCIESFASSKRPPVFSSLLEAK